MKAAAFHASPSSSSSSSSAASAAAAGATAAGDSGVDSGGAPSASLRRLERLWSGNAVVLFSSSGCCMCHVVKRLLAGLGVSPLVVELDEAADGREIARALSEIMRGGGGNGGAANGAATSVAPAVFVGGKLLGGLDQVMASHISGTLVPRLKEAGALWL